MKIRATRLVNLTIGISAALLLMAACSAGSTADADADAGQELVVDAGPDFACERDAESLGDWSDVSSLALDPCLAHENEADCQAAKCKWYTFYRSCSGNAETVHFCSQMPAYLSGIWRWIFVQRVDVPTECYVTIYSLPAGPAWQECRYFKVDEPQCVGWRVPSCELFDFLYGRPASGR